MELVSGMKTIQYMRNFLLGETDKILPFPIQVQKPQEPSTPKGTSLPRTTAQSEGISAAALDTLYRSLASDKNAVTHGCLVISNGKVAAEGWYAPFSSAHWHVTHSLAKSVTGTAIGLLVDEGLLRLDETILSIFPDKRPALPSRRLKSLTVLHLLTMQSHVQFKEIGAVLDSDWVRAFLDAEINKEPGTGFDYNSMNSYLLSAIVKRKTGLSITEYLTPRLFEPLGLGHFAWETCPQGIEKGGWGMYVHLEDMAKLGQLYLQKGKWNVRGAEVQLLSEAWCTAATTLHSRRDTGEGYGYHIWVDDTNDIFLFNGMFGQYVVCAPSQQMVIAVNAGAANLFTRGTALDAILQFLKTCRGTSTGLETKQLAFTLAHLTAGERVPEMPMPRWYDFLFAPQKSAPVAVPEFARSYLNKRYLVPKNSISLVPIVPCLMNDYYSRGAQRFSFAYQEGGRLALHWEENESENVIPISLNGFETCKIAVGGNCFCAGVQARFVKDEDNIPVLKLTLHMLESTSTRVLKFFFHDDGTILLIADEMPNIILTAEELLDEAGGGMGRIRFDIFKDMEYLNYRLERLCTPHVLATPE